MQRDIRRLGQRLLLFQETSKGIISSQFKCKFAVKALIADQFYEDFLKEKGNKKTVFDLSSYVVVACSDGCLRVFVWNDWRLIYKTLPLNDPRYGQY